MGSQIRYTSPTDFCARKYDYIVVGGGTAGLVVAARLSENPALTVGVLEAGPAALGLESIDIPGLYGQALGTDYDWKFQTTPQVGLGGRTLDWPRGKVLGGTSALNFMTWNRACREDYDAWRDLGNEGWGWDDLLPYFKKSESFHIPNKHNQEANSLYYDEDALGKSGPIHIGYAPEYSASHPLWHQTMEALGVDTNKAHLSGSNVGAWTNLGSVDPATGNRSYATAYYLPNASRPNLDLLTEAQVTQVILEDDDGDLMAKGVRFKHGGAALFTHASREVIICAGSVQSPQLLELSGIGDPVILRKAGIPIKISNKNVGENLQDHIMAAMIFEVDPSLATPDDLKQNKASADAAHEQYKTSRTGPLSILANSICYLPFSHIIPPAQLQSLSQVASSVINASEQGHITAQQHWNPASSTRVGQIEFIFDLGNWNPYFQPPPSSDKKYATCLIILQHPFSKGSIHVTSDSVDDKPVIDPQYYSGNGHLDLSLMIHAARFAAYRLSQTSPLANIIRGRAFPPQVSPDGEEDESFWGTWLTRTTITDWHPVGTCAMGGHRGAEGGVVDARLRVYGVKGLRVVDASVMPLQIGAHLQATVYAIGEKAAAMILEDAALDR
ncbi:putative choline dehydrogenase [Pestalotiopsis sp. NC0098]|nr:putative choline dehydrogenase [Pestalotiopsis sp. NC0098]